MILAAVGAVIGGLDVILYDRVQALKPIVSKFQQEGKTDYVPPGEAEMERELGKSEADSK